jgi:rhodanese-related sulfurtransferase
MPKSITPEELKTRLQSEQQPLVLDVRRKGDYEAAPEKIGTASWNDPERADEWSQNLPKDQPIVLYCVKGGSVSQSVAERLEKTHTDVRFLEGGIKAWKESGEPVE